ncbi:MAG: glycosyltransferase [Actinobacteria bacterium]|nr:MAG: glycosyltransferase [Actinomycetota bacterium]
MLDSDGRPAPTDRQDPAGRRLKILHLILMLGETNGQYNEHCLPLIGERDLSISTYFVPRLTPPPEITMFAGDGTLMGFFRSLRRALDADDYDVIHAHAPQSGVLLLLAVLARRRSRRLRRSLVYTVQDSFYDYRLRDKALMVLPLVTFHRVIFCSGSAYDSLPWALKRLVRDRWRVVQNGADIDRVDRAIAAAPVDEQDGPFTVLSVGRLDVVKDPFAMLDAFARRTASRCEASSPEKRCSSRVRRPTSSSPPRTARVCRWPSWKRWLLDARSSCPTSRPTESSPTTPGSSHSSGRATPKGSRGRSGATERCRPTSDARSVAGAERT